MAACLSACLFLLVVCTKKQHSNDPMVPLTRGVFRAVKLVFMLSHDAALLSREDLTLNLIYFTRKLKRETKVNRLFASESRGKKKETLIRRRQSNRR
jgi:hypothetical protein